MSTTDEKVGEILLIVTRIVPMVEEHHNTLYGNGSPGVKEDLSLTMQRQKDCPARKAMTAEGKRLGLAHVAVVIAVISCLTSVVLAVVTFIRGGLT